MAVFFAQSCHPDDKRATENSQRLGVAAKSNFVEIFVVSVTYTCLLKKEIGPQNTKSLGKGRSRQVGWPSSGRADPSRFVSGVD